VGELRYIVSLLEWFHPQILLEEKVEAMIGLKRHLLGAVYSKEKEPLLRWRVPVDCWPW
jgi:hypothetical protein